MNNEQSITCKIYKITNKLNGKFYIGSTIDIDSRWEHHLMLLRLGTHNNKIQPDWDDSLESDWLWEIIEDDVPIDYQFKSEQYWLDTTQSYSVGYNVSFKAGSYQNIHGILLDYKDDRIKGILTDIEDGIPYRIIAKHHNVSIGTVTNYKKTFLPKLYEKHMMERLSRKKKYINELSKRNEKDALINDRNLQIIQDIENNVPYRTISKQYEVSLGTISNLSKFAIK